MKRRCGDMEEMLCLPRMHDLDYQPLLDTTLMEDEMGYFWPYAHPTEYKSLAEYLTIQ